jgi:hypothetical protein
MKSMTLVLWVLGATVLVLGLTVVGGSVEGNHGPLPDWDKSRAWFQEEGQRDEPPGIAEPAPPLQAEDETEPPLQEEGITPPTPPLQAEDEIAYALQEEEETAFALQEEGIITPPLQAEDESGLALQENEMAPPLQEGEIAPPLQEENETALALQAEAALALQQEEIASSLQAEEVAPPSTTGSVDSGGEGVVGGSSPAEPPTTPVLVEPPSNTQPATSVSQADELEPPTPNTQPATPVQGDEAEGGNDQVCEQQRGKTSNGAIERADQSVRVDDQASKQANQVRAQAVSASVVTGVAAAADGSSTASQRACVQQGIEDHGDQTLVIRILRGVLPIP